MPFLDFSNYLKKIPHYQKYSLYLFFFLIMIIIYLFSTLFSTLFSNLFIYFKFFFFFIIKIIIICIILNFIQGDTFLEHLSQNLENSFIYSKVKGRPFHSW